MKTLLKGWNKATPDDSANPILVADKPWEGTLIETFSANVFKNPQNGQWQMFYDARPAELLLCAAFSHDGIHWTKPQLGLQEWQGSKDNNTVLQLRRSSGRQL